MDKKRLIADYDGPMPIGNCKVHTKPYRAPKWCYAIFLIDCTNSMEPYEQAVRNSLQTMKDILMESGENIKMVIIPFAGKNIEDIQVFDVIPADYNVNYEVERVNLTGTRLYYYVKEVGNFIENVIKKGKKDGVRLKICYYVMSDGDDNEFLFDYKEGEFERRTAQRKSEAKAIIASLRNKGVEVFGLEFGEMARGVFNELGIPGNHIENIANTGEALKECFIDVSKSVIDVSKKFL